MIQISNLETLEATDVPKLLKLIKPVLKKREKLHKKYTRDASASTVMFSNSVNKTVIPFEKFITDLAAGYTSGKPIYSVSDTNDEDKLKLLTNLLDKKQKEEDYKKGMEIIIDYVSSYNDDETENYDLIHDILELTSCYEIIYENDKNEIVYSRYDPLQTVAIYDYSSPVNLIGLVRTWEEKDINDKSQTIVELTDKFGTRKYVSQGKVFIESDMINHEWGDVPAIAVESNFAIFETCEDIINSYEQLIQNVRNTYQYNDSDCKMKITGYTPENPMVIENDKGELIVNQARVKEDEAWIKSLTVYVQEGGDVSWLIKNLDATGVQTILKVYVDLMFQLAGIPNTSDLAFNSADLNASAIDRKFYVMNMATASIVAQLKKAYLRRWELIFGRINLKKGTEFDFRDIEIEIPKNLPANDDERVDSMLKLQNILSLQTIIEKLGYNYTDEKNKKDSESEDNMLKNMERMALISNNQTDIQRKTSFEESSKLKTNEEIIETKEKNNEEKE